MVNIAFSQGGDVVTYDRYAFFQWDSGQQLQITGLTLEPTVEIHFANSGYPAIVMLGETISGTTTVNVPDIVLQRAGDMNVYIYRTNGTLTYTFKAVTFSVRKREKPVDYVEQVQPGIVAQLVNKLNRVIDEGIASYVPDTAAVNQMIQNYVPANLIANNLTTTAAGLALDARQGKALNDGKINIAKIADNLTTNDASYVLSAKQGKTLNDSLTLINQQTLKSTAIMASDTDYKTGANIKEIHSSVFVPSWMPSGFANFGIFRRTEASDFYLYEYFAVGGANRYACCALSKTADLTTASWTLVK